MSEHAKSFTATAAAGDAALPSGSSDQLGSNEADDR